MKNRSNIVDYLLTTFDDATISEKEFYFHFLQTLSL